MHSTDMISHFLAMQIPIYDVYCRRILFSLFLLLLLHVKRLGSWNEGGVRAVPV